MTNIAVCWLIFNAAVRWLRLFAHPCPPPTRSPTRVVATPAGTAEVGASLGMARDVDAIDAELSRAVARRHQARYRIAALSQAIITDTREIDRLLAERMEASDAELLAMTGDDRG